MSDFTGFTFNGRHSSEFNILKVASNSGYQSSLIPTIEDYTLDIPGRDGTYFYNGRYKEKNIEINIAFDSVTEKNLRELTEWLGTNEEGELIFDELPYKKYIVKVKDEIELTTICFDEPDISKSTDGNIIFQRIYKGSGSISFIAYYPFAISVDKDLDSFQFNKINQKVISESDSLVGGQYVPLTIKENNSYVTLEKLYGATDWNRNLTTGALVGFNTLAKIEITSAKELEFITPDPIIGDNKSYIQFQLEEPLFGDPETGIYDYIDFTTQTEHHFFNRIKLPGRGDPGDDSWQLTENMGGTYYTVFRLLDADLLDIDFFSPLHSNKSEVKVVNTFIDPTNKEEAEEAPEFQIMTSKKVLLMAYKIDLNADYPKDRTLNEFLSAIYQLSPYIIARNRDRRDRQIKNTSLTSEIKLYFSTNKGIVSKYNSYIYISSTLGYSSGSEIRERVEYSNWISIISNIHEWKESSRLKQSLSGYDTYSYNLGRIKLYNAGDFETDFILRINKKANQNINPVYISLGEKSFSVGAFGENSNYNTDEYSITEREQAIFDAQGIIEIDTSKDMIYFISSKNERIPAYFLLKSGDLFKIPTGTEDQYLYVSKDELSGDDDVSIEYNYIYF